MSTTDLEALPISPRAPRRLGHWLLPLVLAIGALSACSSGSSGGTPAAGQTPPPSAPATATGGPDSVVPTSAHFHFTGTGGASGAIIKPAVQCNEPSLSGPQIRVFATAPGAATSTMIVIHAGVVDVRYDTGAGATYRERDFTGTGLTGFDPSNGVHVSGALQETTQPGGSTSGLGAITAISGAVDCGTQTQGSSTVTVAGNTPFGALSGAASPVSVECNPNGALELGILHTASTPVFLDLGLNTRGINVLLNETGKTPVVYQLFGKHLVTKTGRVITVRPSTATSSTGKTVRVSGSATCGS